METQRINILITGAGGQLGQSFQAIAQDYPQFNLVLANRKDLDISDEADLRKAIEIHAPKAIINCAAYTNVEKAEDEPEIALHYNATSLKIISAACKANNIPLVHFSTDYVFNGLKKTPYTENDYCNPLSKYGESKREGEIILELEKAPHYTLRVSWLYSTFGNNFYKTILRRAKEMGHLRVVDDQIASPTYAAFLADDVLQLLNMVLIEKQKVPYGIYHYEQTGEASWFDFATKILEYSGIKIPIDSVVTEAFPMKATRPTYSKLSGHLFFKTTDIKQRSWEEGLRACIAFDQQ